MTNEEKLKEFIAVQASWNIRAIVLFENLDQRGVLVQTSTINDLKHMTKMILDLGDKKQTKTLFELEDERMQWSLETFPEATSKSSLEKLRSELNELEHAMEHGIHSEVKEEYVDALMCLLDSAGRRGIDLHELTEAFALKLAINKSREWVKNPDNTYSHVKNNEIKINETTVEETNSIDHCNFLCENPDRCEAPFCDCKPLTP